MCQIDVDCATCHERLADTCKLKGFTGGDEKFGEFAFIISLIEFAFCFAAEGTDDMREETECK